MKTLNLKVGDPQYMKPFWDQQKIINVKFRSECFYPQNWDDLNRHIAKLHKNIHNIDINPDHIVYGNGASQLVSAAVSALTDKATSPQLTVKMSAPYWRRIPSLMAIGAKQPAVILSEDYGDIHFVTSPNNPDGVVSGDIDVADIVDACYNWPQYTALPLSTAMRPINIYGIAKAVGLAGLRFGWAIVPDNHLRDRMREYIDLTTAGVSTLVQERVYCTMVYINNLILDKKQTPFQYAAEVLDTRWSRTIEAFNKTGIKISNPRQGMFLWLYSTDGIDLPKLLLDKYGIICMTGAECGIDNSFARISLGCTDDEFNDFIKRIETNHSSS